MKAQGEHGAWEVFLVFLRLGLTSFGGPVAHLGYFRHEFVERRRWLGEAAYADLVALCQFLPGPASSQVGLALGLMRAGYRGALAAWAGFTLPSACALIVLALGFAHAADAVPTGLLHGLKVVAVAVVAQAVWGMARSLCPDTPRRLIMMGSAGVLLAWPGTATQLLVMAGAAAIGLSCLRSSASAVHDAMTVPVGRRAGVLWLALFALLLVLLPLMASSVAAHVVAVLDAFYRAGALVFGGGHVVLPLLQASVVPPGWVSEDAFLAGYGAAQAVPGPLFTFAAFLGASLQQAPSGWTGGVLALLAIFAPAFLLVVGALPFWASLRARPRVRSALMGINAAVAGLLLAALWDPVITGAVRGIGDLALAALALLALMRWQWPPWVVVAACACAGWAMGRFLA
ncbi:MAG: chromate efflux transporter [Burkholderiaceae bacterium]